MSTDQPTNHLIHRALRASVASVGWTVVAGSVLIAIGVSRSSTVIAAVGAIGFVDAVGSVALAHHFAHALRHSELDDRIERRAHRIVTVGLLALGVVTIVVSVVRLAGGTASDGAVAGPAIAATSAVVLAVLAVTKVRVGRRIPSHALVADGFVSAIGAAQGVVASVGAVLATSFDLHAADPVAAIVVAAVAIALAVGSWTPPRD